MQWMQQNKPFQGSLQDHVGQKQGHMSSRGSNRVHEVQQDKEPT